MEGAFAPKAILFLVGITAVCALAVGTGRRAPVYAETPNPCDVITVSEAEAVLESPLSGDPQFIDLSQGLLSCTWETVIEHGFPENKNEMSLGLYSGPDADFFFDNTYAPIQEEVTGIGDRAKWVAAVEQFPDFVWGGLWARFEQYYVAISISKYDDEKFKYELDSSGEMIEMMLLVLSRLHPRAPVEFTQAIQELQDYYELQQDLGVDGEPPVPIIAGKPAVVRVYYNEVDEADIRTVELSGVGSDEVTAPVIPGCTVEEQRRQEGGCDFADLYFTPPPGQWTATITIRDENGAQLDKMEFTLTSVKTDLLKVRAISVCDAQTGGVWDCGDTAEFASLLPFLRATFPGDVQLVRRLSQVQRDVATTNPVDDWWDNVVTDLWHMWTAAGSPSDEYFYGAVRGVAGMGTAAGSTGGIAYRPGHAGASRTEASRQSISGGLRDTAAEVVAHELGHNTGRPHVPSPAASGCYNQPSGLDPGWPNGNSPFIEEVGFDVANRKAMPEDEFTDWETYCTPRWISVYTYKALIDAFSAGAQPAAVQAAVAAGTPGNYWLVSGSIDGSAVSFDPLFELETGADTGPGSGGYRIEVKDGAGGTLFTRSFAPAEAHSEDISFAPSFAELIPVNPAAKTITIYAPDDTLLEMVTLEGDRPTVEVTMDGPQIGGASEALSVDWTVTDADSGAHTAWVEFSDDGGETWETVSVGIEGNQLSIDGGIFPGTDEGMFRVRVSDGVNTGMGLSEQFALAKKVPEAAITYPGDEQVFNAGSVVWLQGYAEDPEDGNLDQDIQWVSSRDGILGAGASLPVYGLSPGTHTITLTVRDSDDNTATDSIAVIVGEASGEELTQGDNDCDGDVDAVDALRTLRYVALLGGNQPPGCPGLGSEVASLFGDLDCDDDVDAVDALRILRYVAALPLNPLPSCPKVGQPL